MLRLKSAANCCDASPPLRRPSAHGSRKHRTSKSCSAHATPQRRRRQHRISYAERCTKNAVAASTLARGPRKTATRRERTATLPVDASHGLQGERRALLAQGHHAQPLLVMRFCDARRARRPNAFSFAPMASIASSHRSIARADHPHDARLPGVGLALEGQRGHVPRHVRDAALGLEEAPPLFGPAAPAVAGHAAGALVGAA